MGVAGVGYVIVGPYKDQCFPDKCSWYFVLQVDTSDALASLAKDVRLYCVL